MCTAGNATVQHASECHDPIPLLVSRRACQVPHAAGRNRGLLAAFGFLTARRCCRRSMSAMSNGCGGRPLRCGCHSAAANSFPDLLFAMSQTYAVQSLHSSAHSAHCPNTSFADRPTLAGKNESSLNVKRQLMCPNSLAKTSRSYCASTDTTGSDHVPWYALFLFVNGSFNLLPHGLRSCKTADATPAYCHRSTARSPARATPARVRRPR